MRATLRTGLLAGILIIVPAVTWADWFAMDWPDYSHDERLDQYWYGAVGLGISSLDPETGQTSFVVDSGYDFAAKLSAGYRWNELWAIEGFWADLGEVSLDPHGVIEYSTMGVGALYHLDFFQRHPRFNLFFKSGLSQLQTKSDIDFEQLNDVQLFVGAGIEYQFNHDYILRAELERYDADVSLLSLSISKRFGLSSHRKRKNLGADEEAVVGVVEDDTVVAEINDSSPLSDAVEPVINAILADGDGDGVLDSVDQCPDTVSAVAIDGVGCELFPESSVTNKIHILFEKNSSSLQVDHLAVIEKIAGYMKKYPDSEAVIVGHTDSWGDTIYNKQLAEKRAKTIAKLLTDYYQITPLRIWTVARGKGDPAESNDTDDGRRENRRVVVTVTR